MNYQDLMYWHLSTVLPAALLGGLLLAFAKGTPSHRLMGKNLHGVNVANSDHHIVYERRGWTNPA